MPDDTAPEVLPAPKSKRRYVRSKGRNLSHGELASVVDRHLRGVPAAAIARDLVCHRATVDKAIKRFTPIFKDLPQAGEYAQVRQQILTAMELGSLKLMADPAKQADANLYQAAVAFREIHKARRLEQGLSTANTEAIVKFTRLDPDDDAA